MAAVFLGFLPAVAVTDAEARAFHGRKDGLAEVFPQADSIESERFFLGQEQMAAVAKLSGAELEDGLVTIYVARKGEDVLGYGFLETHTVRTKPETLLIRVSPEGKVERILQMAFYEPLDYVAGEKWLDQFTGKELAPALRVRRDIHGIGGSTLTAYAATQGVRKSLALHKLLVMGVGQDEPEGDR